MCGECGYVPIYVPSIASCMPCVHVCVVLFCIQVGLLLLPHDGNPHNSKCLLAHPGNVGFGASVS